MSPAPSPSSSSAKRSIDVRTLNLVQLQQLAERGSRRAKAELEGRMRALATSSAEPQATTAAPPAPSPLSPAEPEPAPTPTERAAPGAQRPAVAAASASVTAAAAAEAAPPDEPPQPHEAMAQQLALIARQDEARARADGPPRLVGMVLIAWGVLMLLGGLVMLSHRGAAYYLLGGVGVAAVGWLLLQCSRWALAAQAALLLLALAWAWTLTEGSLAMVLVQAAPLWIAALWMAVPLVREPLE